MCDHCRTYKSMLKEGDNGKTCYQMEMSKPIGMQPITVQPISMQPIAMQSMAPTKQSRNLDADSTGCCSWRKTCCDGMCCRHVGNCCATGLEPRMVEKPMPTYPTYPTYPVMQPTPMPPPYTPPAYPYPSVEVPPPEVAETPERVPCSQEKKLPLCYGGDCQEMNECKNKDIVSDLPRQSER